MGENTKVVQQAYDAFGSGDIPGLLALLDDGVQWSSPKTLPHGGEFRGPSGVGNFFAGIGGNWSSLVVAVESVGDLDPHTVVGVVRADGTRTERQEGRLRRGARVHRGQRQDHAVPRVHGPRRSRRLTRLRHGPAVPKVSATGVVAGPIIA